MDMFWFNLPLAQSGILLCFIFIIMYYHTPEHRKIPNCTKDKIEPQQFLLTHEVLWIGPQEREPFVFTGGYSTTSGYQGILQISNTDSIRDEQ